MSADEFSNNLYDQLENELTEIGINYANILDSSRELYLKIIPLIKSLKQFIIKYKFENKNEEIHFFKNIKPKFLSKLVYYQKIFNIQSRLPIGMRSDINSYYLKQLESINNYFNDNQDFIRYYKSNSTLLDEIYFTRKEPDLWLSFHNEEYDIDQTFTTLYDHTVSKFLAYEMVSNFIIEEINKSETPSKTEWNYHKTIHQNVTWTASKAALIELLYAIQTNGACNNGVIEVKQLATHFENIFNVKLGNYYRTFQELRIRKISRTNFLDQLKESLIKRMDESDENPRF